ncbi:MAG: uroporphyrinogen decarboxylase family protein [Clostridiales bacterium]|nr:uroporphyrinogen decarboxylase family protein [Clostridiales bacterium]
MDFLTSRERVLRAVNHQEVDRIPVDYCSRDDVTKKFISYIGVKTIDELLDRLGVDIRKVYIAEHNLSYESKVNGILKGNSPHSGGKYIFFDDKSFKTSWGIVFKQGRDGLYDQWVNGPFTSTKNLNSFEWPYFNIFDSIETIKKRVTFYKGKYAVMGSLNLPFKVCWHMRGLENYLCDMLIDVPFAQELLERISLYEKEKGMRLAKAGVDIIGFIGDIAMQNGMLVNPNSWRSIEKPILADMINSFKSINPDIKIFFHSDGDITEVLKDLIEIGVDIINPVQPECMDPEKVKKEFGDKITIHGAISIQKTLPYGTIDDVKHEVSERIRICGKGGGLIICPANALQNDIPMENIKALYETALGRSIDTF